MLGERLEVPDDVVGEPPERPTGVGDVTVAALEGRPGQQVSERVQRRPVVGRHRQELGRRRREVAPPGLPAGGRQVDAADALAGPPVGGKRVRDGGADLDGYPCPSVSTGREGGEGLAVGLDRYHYPERTAARLIPLRFGQ